jgi:hypothetical protein
MGRDIHRLEVFRSRLPMDIFDETYKDVRKASRQYGRMEQHGNEEARNRYISSVSRTKLPIRFKFNTEYLQFFSTIVDLFGCAITNRPEGMLDAEFTKKGRIEHLFSSMDSVCIVFIEVKKTYTIGPGRLDVIAQVLAEAAGMYLQIVMTLLIILACDYVNSKSQHWVPILAILCDGEKFEFLVYDSVTKSVHSSRMMEGVVDIQNRTDRFVPSLKMSKVAINLPPFRC